MNKAIYSVIVTYNGSAWIKVCLGSFEKNHNIIVVDNASEDNTIDLVKDHFPEVHLIKSEVNLGFGAANNIGIKYALKQGADYVFLLNQDAWIQKGTLELLKHALEKNNEYGVISPIHLNGTGEMLDHNFGDYLYNKGGRKFITDKILGRTSKSLIDIDFVNAAAWLLSRKCIEKVGFFDPLFFQYGEDDNYLQRVKYYSFKIGILTSAFIYHDREGNINSHIKADFNSKLKVYKRKWADVNEIESIILKDIRKVIIKKTKHVWFSLLTLNMEGFKRLKQERKELKKVGNLCLESRKKNMTR
jgi:GT2 family glycosyltransferase